MINKSVQVARQPAFSATVLVFALWVSPCTHASDAWSEAIVSNSELNAMRGGVLLPDGLNIDIGIDIQTQVNGVLVLHTVLSTAAPAGDQLRVFSGGPTPDDSAGTAVTLGNGAPPTLTLNRSGASTTLVNTQAPLNPTVVVLNAPTNVWPQYPDETRVNVVPNGPVALTSNGQVQVQQSADATAVSLTGNGLTIEHLLGNPTGAVIANQLSNQVIQTTTVVDVDLHSAWPAIANAMFGVGNLATAAVRRF